MKNLVNKIAIKRRYIIIEEADVMNILKIINKHDSWFHMAGMAIGNCGWANQLTKWFIHFDATEVKWNEIVCELKTGDFKEIIQDKGNFWRCNYKEL